MIVFVLVVRLSFKSVLEHRASTSFCSCLCCRSTKSFENESAFWNCPNWRKQILKMKAHFETVQIKGNRFWKWKCILKLSKLKETDFENESTSLLARCFIPVVSLQNYFQKYHTCGDPSKLFSKTVTCGDLSNSSSFSFQFLSLMVTFAILLVQKILQWWPFINQINFPS